MSGARALAILNGAKDRLVLIALAITICIPTAMHAQDARLLPPTRADTLLAEGRWAEAEAAYYEQSEQAPREPFARAALGRFLAMKGALRPGIVLIDEARMFGLDAESARRLLAPWRAMLAWRTNAFPLTRDSVLGVRAGATQNSLFRLALPGAGVRGRPQGRRGTPRETVWHDVVDRPIGLDSVNAPNHPMGIEIFEAYVPSLDTRGNALTLHGNDRSALAATGRRYPVLRSTNGVRVLMGEQRVVGLPAALRELAPAWWQLDLVHGFLVVR